MATEQLAPLSKLTDIDSLSDKAYAAIKRAILTLKLGPGEPLVERTLAQQLGISKTPVRRALVRLEREGLVTMQPYRGTFVASISPEDVRDIFQLREVLEGMAARMAAPIVEPAELDELRRALDAAEGALEAGRYEECSQLGHGLHELLLRKCENDRLRAIVANLDDHLQRFRLVSARIPGRLARSSREHRDVLEALEKHDPYLAEELMRRHLRGVLDDLMAGESLDKATANV